MNQDPDSLDSHDVIEEPPRAAIDGQAEDLQSKIEIERKRMTQRPTIRIRTRITVAFLLVFALCAVITLWIIYTLSQIQTRIHFLEAADSYMSDIQQARRFEKNFLLYGTNLDDALEYLANAQNLLANHQSTMRKVLGDQDMKTLSRHVTDYERLLRRLGKPGSQHERDLTVTELRSHGAQMISFAMDFSNKEREAVDREFLLARRMPFIFLGVLFAMMPFIAAFLAHQFMTTLSRFMEYAKRIGEGDFSPITPVRKYSDEFTQLALAFNQMIAELDRRHNILVESHKVRAIGTLVAGVAHELNNPLNNIMLTASLLLEGMGDLDEEEKLEMLRDVIGEAERSQRIVRNLLDFARESEVKVEPLNPGEIVENAIRLVGNQVKMHKIKLEVEKGRDLPPVHGDAQMLCQVFVNLILNAVDALSEKGKISVRISKSREEGFLAVDIQDNGPGIPDHILPRIFEPFFTTKSKGRGTGLGLSVSRGIVRKLGGYIRVTSKVDVGTTFTVLLPTTDIPYQQAAPQEVRP